MNFSALVLLRLGGGFREDPNAKAITEQATKTREESKRLCKNSQQEGTHHENYELGSINYPK